MPAVSIDNFVPNLTGHIFFSNIPSKLDRILQFCFLFLQIEASAGGSFGRLRDARGMLGPYIVLSDEMGRRCARATSKGDAGQAEAINHSWTFLFRRTDGGWLRLPPGVRQTVKR